MRKLTRRQFIKRSKRIHNNKYNYIKVIYINGWTKICIICPIHGEFWQTPEDHLSGRGCPGCKNKKISLSKINNKAYDIVKRFKEVHGDRYSYDNFVYKHNHKKGFITCLKHGDFLQTPNNHLNGAGCPKCNYSRGEAALENIFIKNNIQYIPQYRIPEVVNELYYDFYLPEFNALIEFHGEQHFVHVRKFHKTDYEFDAQKVRDEIVRHNAICFKYNYIEFNYKQLQKLTKDKFDQMVISLLLKCKKYLNPNT